MSSGDARVIECRNHYVDVSGIELEDDGTAVVLSINEKESPILFINFRLTPDEARQLAGALNEMANVADSIQDRR